MVTNQEQDTCVIPLIRDELQQTTWEGNDDERGWPREAQGSLPIGIGDDWVTTHILHQCYKTAIWTTAVCGCVCGVVAICMDRMSSRGCVLSTQGNGEAWGASIDKNTGWMYEEWRTTKGASLLDRAKQMLSEELNREHHQLAHCASNI